MMELKMVMPKEIWMIEYGCLVWDRSILGFVPNQFLYTKTHKEIMEKLWFLDLDSVTRQVQELKSLGVKATIVNFKLQNEGEM